MKRKVLILPSTVIALAIAGIIFIFENPDPVGTQPDIQANMASSASAARQAGLTAYTISEGQHFSFPRIFKTRNRPGRVGWLIRFAGDCDYDLKDGDQKDWNKLCGLYYNFFNTRDNTVMVGWRWNPSVERMELCAYYHVDGSREFTRPLLDVSLEEDLKVEILVDYERKEYTVALERSGDGKRVENKKAFKHDNETCWEISTYFGGNRTAPKDVTILKGYLD